MHLRTQIWKVAKLLPACALRAPLTLFFSEVSATRDGSLAYLPSFELIDCVSRLGGMTLCPCC